MSGEMIQLSESEMKNPEFQQFKDMGLTGLANVGNTCFMNSTLQCISHTYELNNFLDKETYKTRLNKKHDSLILCEWDNLRKLMWSENCIISPGGFVNAMQKVARIKDRVIFTGFVQNDLTEFLSFIFDCFHNSICREVDMVISGTAQTSTDELAQKCYGMMKNMYKKEYSEFLNMFYGIFVSQIESKESSYKNILPEPFFNISVPISPKKTLIDCFDLFTAKEELGDDNKIFNEKTNKKENATKQILFWSLPNILVITLKRFLNNGRKERSLVDFPIDNLDLSKYVIGYDKHSYVYDLYGICNHSGGSGGGHYYAYVKNANGKWYEFNDARVEEFSNLEKLKSCYAYCFFYRKQKR
tara:strand:+ start:3711 stop:4781 length:1071 start_codon:yes stop_codon:yes gene_type:complete